MLDVSEKIILEKRAFSYSEDSRIIAPAPSPKKTQSRLSQSVIFEKVSAPIIRAFLYVPLFNILLAMDKAYIKPEHTAEMSNAGQSFFIPRFLFTRHDVEGAFLSGVAVATIIKSISSLSILEDSKALIAAFVARSDVY